MTDEEYKEWLSKNPIARGMTALDRRVEDVINGKVKLLIVTGPPSIGKTSAVLDHLGDHTTKLKTEWSAKERRRNDAERRTVWEDETASAVFNPPHRVIGGPMNAVVFYASLYYTSEQGELLFIDDATNLNDRRIGEMLAMATDATIGHHVAYHNPDAKLIDDHLPFQFKYEGSIILLLNEGAKSISPILLDRAVQLVIKGNTLDIMEYIGTLAFARRSLEPYAIQVIKEAALDSSTRLVEASGTVEEVMGDVADYWQTNWERLPLSFRLLQKLIFDRVHHPDIWKELAESYFIPHWTQR